MINPSTGTTGSATLTRILPRSDDFGGLKEYLEQAAWQKLNQSRAALITHLERDGRDNVEKAWENALLTMADKIRGERIRESAQAIGRMIRANALAVGVNPPRPFIAPGEVT